MASRLLNAAEEKDLENYCPLLGLRDVPLVTLEQALVPITAAVGLDADSLRALLSAARRTLKRLKKKKELRPLSEQEAMAVNIYTQESNLYRRLNSLMRQRDRTALKPLFPYLKLLLTGLHKLRPTKQTVYRGVKLHLADRYSKDDDFVWWPFTSATANVEVLQSFLGGEGKRTLFTMHVGRALDIERYSAIAVEQERMILPGTAFTVKGTLDVGGGLTIIQIAEDTEEDSLIPGFSFEKAQDAKTDKKTPGGKSDAKWTPIRGRAKMVFEDPSTATAEWREQAIQDYHKAIAFLMGGHSRLGADSPVLKLPQPLVVYIAKFIWPGPPPRFFDTDGRYTLPICVTTQICPCDQETEVIMVATANKRSWASGQADGLTIYGATHRQDFTFRTGMFRSFPPNDHIGRFQLMRGQTHEFKWLLFPNYSAYFIDGRLVARATLRVPEDIPASNPHIGFVTWASDYDYRHFRVRPATQADRDASL